jgi:hypothetical protein
MTLDRAITILRRVLVLGLCVGVSYFWAAANRGPVGGTLWAMDFGGVYFGARTALRHEDPYNPEVSLHEEEAGLRSMPGMPAGKRGAAPDLIDGQVFPPTTLLLVVPLAMLPWPLAQGLWLWLTSGLMLLAGFLIWDVAGKRAPGISGLLTGFVLANLVLLLLLANPAGVAVAFCVIAAWCFGEERFAAAGVLMLALSLVIKPHDSGFVWLYFLLAGGTHRKRALQTLAVAAVVSVCAAIWIAPSSPHWVAGLRGNVAQAAARGADNDPGPSGISAKEGSPLVDLQAAVSIFKNDPHLYRPVSYVVGGGMILAWMVVVLRKRSTREGTLLALAAISALTLLPVHHRADDAKILLLAIPACALLWAGKGARRWIALVLTSAAIVFTSDVPRIFLSRAVQRVAFVQPTMAGKMHALALQPAPLVLLATGIFYLWVYIRYEPRGEGAGETAAAKWLDAALAE